MDCTACTEPQCLYKGDLYLISVSVQGCIYLYLLFETYHICKIYSVVAVLYLEFVLHLTLFRT